MKARLNSFFFLLIIGGAMGCAFDNDLAFAPKTLSSFLLLEDSVSGNRSLLEFKNNTAVLDVQNQVSIPVSGLTDVALSADGLWLCDRANQQVILIEPLQKTIISTYNFPDIVPHFISIGDKEFLISDSSSGFAEVRKIKNNDQFSFQPLQGPPSLSFFAAGKFYLKKGCCSIGILREGTGTETQSYSLPDTISSPDTIVQIQKDYSATIRITAQNGSASKQYNIDPNSELLSGGAATNHDWILYSPWQTASFGTEIIGSVSLESQTLPGTGITSTVSNFSCDFFSGNIFYQSGDSLFLQKWGTTVKLWSYPLGTKRLVKGLHILGREE